MGFQNGFGIQASLDGQKVSDEEEYLYWFFVRLEKHCVAHPDTSVPEAAIAVLTQYRREQSRHHPAQKPGRRKPAPHR